MTLSHLALCPLTAFVGLVWLLVYRELRQALRRQWLAHRKFAYLKRARAFIIFVYFFPLEKLVNHWPPARDLQALLVGVRPTSQVGLLRC